MNGQVVGMNYVRLHEIVVGLGCGKNISAKTSDDCANSRRRDTKELCLQPRRRFPAKYDHDDGRLAPEK
jgi:hypothetical protein